jgi:hypothetical protein
MSPYIEQPTIPDGLTCGEFRRGLTVRRIGFWRLHAPRLVRLVSEAATAAGAFHAGRRIP